ncbi:hypothetical protein [Sorangium sp. So ce1024]|uniref:hypothetical protein n=1 Tax=Sorangium sp. So ce1024 TaxID=3133327 RepID=UPI003F00CB16
MTTRHDLEGTLARWFALDADSHLGVFTGAYAAWPSAVFDDYAAVSAADELLDSAPVVTEGMLSAAYRASKADPTFPLREASRGLYSFDADPDHGGSTIYVLGASPVQPLIARAAPEVLLRAASLVRFARLRFADVTQLDLAHLVPFVVGDG